MHFEELNITPEIMKGLADTRRAAIKSAGSFPDVLYCIEVYASKGLHNLRYITPKDNQDCVCAILDNLRFNYTVKSDVICPHNYVNIEIDWSNNEV